MYKNTQYLVEPLVCNEDSVGVLLPTRGNAEWTAECINPNSGNASARNTV